MIFSFENHLTNVETQFNADTFEDAMTAFAEWDYWQLELDEMSLYEGDVSVNGRRYKILALGTDPDGFINFQWKAE